VHALSLFPYTIGHSIQRNRAAHQSDYAGQALAAGVLLTSVVDASNIASGGPKQQAHINKLASSPSSPPSSSEDQQPKKVNGPYTAFSSSLSHQGVVKAVLAQHTREVGDGGDSGGAASMAAKKMAETTAALVRRVRFAYRRDYTMFASIDALVREQQQQGSQISEAADGRESVTNNHISHASSQTGDNDEANELLLSPFQASHYFPSVEDALLDQPDEVFQGGRPPAAAWTKSSSGRRRRINEEKHRSLPQQLENGTLDSDSPRLASAQKMMHPDKHGSGFLVDDSELDDDEIVLRVRDSDPRVL
jgi:hypothetical protein